jgi:hypothetical protein
MRLDSTGSIRKEEEAQNALVYLAVGVSCFEFRVPGSEIAT